MLKYKGYAGCVIYDDEAHIFHGEIIGIKAVITFQGTTVKEIEQAFIDSIDDYLDWCKEREKRKDLKILCPLSPFGPLGLFGPLSF